MPRRIRRPKGRLMPTTQALRRRLHLLVLVGVTVGPWVTGAGANGPCGYDVTIIQAGDCPPFGPQATIATAVNDLGQIAGYHCQCFCGSDEAFFWDGSTFTALPRPPGFRAARAYGMNDQGWIVGSMTQTGIDLNHAVLWQNDQPLDLGVPAGGNFSEGLAVNSAGQAVGYWGNNVTGPGAEAFLWEAGTMISLDLPMGPNSAASGINDLGQIVGWMGSSSVMNSHAFLWEGGVVTDLGPIPGGLTSNGISVNNSTVIVGAGTVPAEGYPFGLTRAFLWQDGAMVDLGAPTGYLRSAALDLDAAGSIVGRAWGGAPDIGLIWVDGVMHDLNDLIPPGSGVDVAIAHAINARGQIACQGHDNNGDVVGLRLTPLAVSAADVNADGTVDVLDLIELLLCFGQPAVPGCDSEDINADGTVNVLDLIALLLDFGTSCP